MHLRLESHLTFASLVFICVASFIQPVKASAQAIVQSPAAQTPITPGTVTAPATATTSGATPLTTPGASPTQTTTDEKAADGQGEAAASEQDDSPAAQRPIQIPELPPDPRNDASIAYVLRRKAPEFKIPELKIFDSTVSVLLVAKGDNIKPTVALRGSYGRMGWHLFLQDGSPVQTSAGTNEFTVYAHLNGRVSELALVAVGPKNERQLEKIYLYAPNARGYHIVSAWDDLLLSAGLTNMSYQQTGFGAYQSINALISARYGGGDPTSRFGLVASGDMTVLAFASSPINTAPQLFEGKIALSVRPTSKPLGRLRTRLLIGGTYLTMFSNGSPFGFSDLTSPEVGIQWRYVATFREDYLAELRFAPIGGLTSIAQNAVYISGGWSKLLQDSRRLEVSLSYTGYSYQPDQYDSIIASLISLKFGLTL